MYVVLQVNMLGRIIYIFWSFWLVSATAGMAQISLPVTWQGEEKTFNYPFTTTEQGEMILKNTFSLDSLPPNPTDSLYLYFEGIGWESSLELNNIFLGVHKDPFDVWVVPIAPIWCRPGPNTIQVTLSIGQSKAYYPQTFLGIFRPAYVLSRAEHLKRREIQLPQVNSSSPIAVVAPYYGPKGYEYDAFEAARILSHVEKGGFQHIYFPFRPDAKMLELCAKLELKEALTITDSTKVSWINNYPVEAYAIKHPLPFWLDRDLYRTDQYGSSVFRSNKAIGSTFNTDLSFWLVLIIAFPWLSFFILKLLNPALFEFAKNWNQKTVIWIADFADLLATNTGMLVAMQLVRILTATCLLTTIFYFVNEMNQWSLLNWFKDWSLLSQLFYGNYGLEGIFVRSLILVLFIVVVDQLMGWVGSTLFKIKQFTYGVTRINLIGTYPMLWLLSLPWTFALLVEGPLQLFFMWFAIAIMLIYFARKVFISYVALGSFFAFSPPIKILYICALNILPYIIWF